MARLPKELKTSLLFDQSIFVRAAVQGVVKEAGIAALLTALMLLLFLGSWRSTLIVLVSIPLSILVSIVILSWLGQTLNVMTLGGMALAVGILVDDATVEIENVHRHLAKRKPIVRAILDGANEIAVPARAADRCGDSGSGSRIGLSSAGGTRTVDAARCAIESSLVKPPAPCTPPEAIGFIPHTRA